MLGGRDDVEALTRVLDGLQQELTEQREEINDICLLADEIGGLEPLNTDELNTQLDQESQLTKNTMDTLEIVEQGLESIMKMVREFSRVETIKSLSLRKECNDQISEWSVKVDKEYMELIEFHAHCMDVDRKLAKLVAHCA